MNSNEKLKILGYDTRWITYGFLTTEELEIQYTKYVKAIRDPNSDEAKNGYQHTEHLRHASFWKISESNISFTDKKLEQLIELVRCDEDPIMAENLYSYLVRKNSINTRQIEKFKIKG